MLRELAVQILLLLLLSSGLVLHAQARHGTTFALGTTLGAIADQGHCPTATEHTTGGCVAAHSCSPSHAGCSALLVASNLIDPCAEAVPLPAGRVVAAGRVIAPSSRPPIASSTT